MRQVVFVSATPADYEKTHAGQVVSSWCARPAWSTPEVEVRPATHQVDDVLQEIRDCAWKLGERVLITTLTKRMAEQLTDYPSDNGVKVRYLHSDVDNGGARRDHPRPASGRELTCWSASTCCARA